MNFNRTCVEEAAYPVTAIPPQLDIMVTVACNASCAFCVQEATWKPTNTNDDIFLKRAKETFDKFYHLGGRRVVITGGEPTLFMSRVLDVLDIMHPYGELEVKAVYTNGGLLLSPCPGRESLTIAQAMRENGLQDVNLSVHHHNDEINNKILGLADKPSTAMIISHLLECGLKVRFNLTLQKGGIDNYQGFSDYINEAFRLGAKDVYARELFQYAFNEPKSRTTRDAIRVSQERHIPSSGIIDQALASGEFEQVDERSETCRDKTEIELHHIPTDQKVYVADLTIGTEKRDTLPYLIHMPDGYLYKGWLGEEDKLKTLPHG